MNKTNSNPLPIIAITVEDFGREIIADNPVIFHGVYLFVTVSISFCM